MEKEYSGVWRRREEGESLHLFDCCFQITNIFSTLPPPHCPSMTGNEDDDEDHNVIPVPEDNHKDDHKDNHEDNHEDDPEGVPMSTKKPPAVAKATSTKPAEVVISPPTKKLRCITLIFIMRQSSIITATGGRLCQGGGAREWRAPPRHLPLFPRRERDDDLILMRDKFGVLQYEALLGGDGEPPSKTPLKTPLKTPSKMPSKTPSK
mgnify:CR=1 FL=1